jgi:sentrin-specific protease 8
MPVNNNPFADAAGGSHWSLLVWYAPAAGDDVLGDLPVGFSHWDSAAGTGNLIAANKLAKAIAPVLDNKAIYGLTVVERPCKQQANGSDCGVYMLHYIDCIAGAVSSGAKFGGADSFMACMGDVSEVAIASLRMDIKRAALHVVAMAHKTGA